MNGVLNMVGFDFNRTYSDAPAAVVEAGLSDVWASLDTYHWPSPMAEYTVRSDLARASGSGVNAEAVRRSLASMVAKNPRSFGSVPGVAERLSIEQARVFSDCRAIVQTVARDDETSEVGRVRRLHEVKWVYMGTLADLDAKVSAAMTAARNKAAAPMAGVDRHGDRFQAAISELTMLTSSQNVEAMAQAWNRAVERRSRPELEAWAGIPSTLLGWRAVSSQRTVAERDSEGRITTRMSQTPDRLAARIEGELEAILAELRTPQELEAQEYRRTVQAEELALEAAYRARRGLMDLVA